MKKLIIFITIFTVIFSIFAIPSSAAYQDVSGTKWKAEKGWKAQGGYGWHDLRGTITIHNYTADNLPSYDLQLSLDTYQLGVGYTYKPTDTGDYASKSNNIILVPKNFVGTDFDLEYGMIEFNNTFAFSLHITGGNDTTDNSLRSWLQSPNNGIVDVTNPYIEYTYKKYNADGSVFEGLYSGPLTANKFTDEVYVVPNTWETYEWESTVLVYYSPSFKGQYDIDLDVPEGHYIIASTGYFDINGGDYSLGVSESTLGVYNYDTVSRTWKLYKLINTPTDELGDFYYNIVDEQYLTWTKEDLYWRGRLYYAGDPNFRQPLTERIAEAVRQMVTKVTGPTVVKVMMTVLLCGVSLLALSLVYKKFGRLFPIFRL